METLLEAIKKLEEKQIKLTQKFIITAVFYLR